MGIGYGGAPRISRINSDSRTRRVGRSLKGSGRAPLRAQLLSEEKMSLEASPDSSNTNARREVLNIYSSEFRNADTAVVNATVVAGYWNDCGFIELRCASDNSLVWGVSNTFGGGPGAVVYMDSSGFMKADNTAFFYDEDFEQLKVYQNTANTSPMLVLENDGAGDASINFLLTGTAGWTLGICNSDDDNLRISSGNTLVSGQDQFIMASDGRLGFGIGPQPSIFTRFRPPEVSATSTYATFYMDLPGKTIDSGTEDNSFFGLRLTSSPTTFDIASGATDDGRRECFRVESLTTNTDFAGTLATQVGGIFITGDSGGAGTATISNSVGLILRGLDSGSATITQAWGIYQTGDHADNFLAGSLGVGSVPPANTALHAAANDSATTPPVWIRQNGTGDASIRLSLSTATQNFTIGIDNSDSDIFKIDPGVSSLSSNAGLNMDSGGNTTFNGTPSTSTLKVNGSFATAINTFNVNTTLNAAHHTVLVNTNSADRVITLPAAASAANRIYIIKKIDAAANTVTIDGNGAETIDGSTTVVLITQYDSKTVQSDGTDWHIL